MVLGSPVAGICADEVIDATPAIEEIDHRYLGDPAFSNLPRKYKMAISGLQDVAHEVNDISFVGVVHPQHGPGFDLWAGGGLSTNPKIAQRLGVWVPLTEVPEVWAGASTATLAVLLVGARHGDLIAAAATPPRLTTELDATLCWLAERPLRAARVLVEHGTRTTPSIVTTFGARLDTDTLGAEPAQSLQIAQSLHINDIGRVSLHTAEPLPVDDAAAKPLANYYSA